MLESRDNNAWSLTLCGLWLHAGLVGASALAVGTLRLLQGESDAAAAIALAICGIALAVGCWGRGRFALENAQAESPAVGADTSEARP